MRVSPLSPSPSPAALCLFLLYSLSLPADLVSAVTAAARHAGPFINLDRLDFGKYVGRPALAKVLCDYIIYHLHEPRRALELCSLATVAVSASPNLYICGKPMDRCLLWALDWTWVHGPGPGCLQL